MNGNSESEMQLRYNVGGQEHWEEGIFSPPVLLSHDLKSLLAGGSWNVLSEKHCPGFPNSLCYATAQGKEGGKNKRKKYYQTGTAEYAEVGTSCLYCKFNYCLWIKKNFIQTEQCFK